MFQRRIDGTTDFYRDWTTYKNGFGNSSSNYWLGLEDIHVMTNAQTMHLRMDVWDGQGTLHLILVVVLGIWTVLAVTELNQESKMTNIIKTLALK